MTLHGHIHDGKIVLDHTGPLPEGAAVHVQIVAPPATPPTQESDEQLPTLAERLKGIIGVLKDLPEDAAINHDHYLYGAPKRS